MKLRGGMVVVIGDDPGANSSQNEQDNRHYAHLSYMPVFEPSNPQEVYEYYKEAAKLSQEKEMPVILRLSTHVCHAKQKVNFSSYEQQEFDSKPRFSSENENYVPITSKVFPMKRRALKRIKDFKSYSNNSDLNQIIDNGNKDKGIITMGVPYLSLRDVMEDMDNKPDVLKLGVIYPLPEDVIKEFLKEHKEVKVLEELDNVLEKDIKVLAFEEGINTEIIGKKDIDDWINEYTPDKVQDVMSKTWPSLFEKVNNKNHEKNSTTIYNGNRNT
jgi:indolepyruvate ferredoxin oxidoreductase alpha subunit